MQQYTFHAQHDSASYNRVIKLASRVNEVLKKFADTNYINTVQEARNLIGYPVLRPTYGNKNVCDLFTNTALGENLFHNVHDDFDFGLSGVVFLSDMDSCCSIQDDRELYGILHSLLLV